MKNRPPARESRSVRLRDEEWVLAEAIARMSGEAGAGHGLRMALAREAERLARKGYGPALKAHLAQIKNERAGGTT